MSPMTLWKCTHAIVELAEPDELDAPELEAADDEAEAVSFLSPLPASAPRASRATPMPRHQARPLPDWVVERCGLVTASPVLGLAERGSPRSTPGHPVAPPRPWVGTAPTRRDRSPGPSPK